MWLLAVSIALAATWLVLTPIGGILFGLVLITIIVALSRSPQCGHCGQTLPRVRVPATFRQAWRGGWICPHCGSEVDRKGRVLASPDGLAIDPTLPPPLVAMPPPIATPNTAPGETAGAAIILPEPPVIARAEANGRRGPSSPP